MNGYAEEVQGVQHSIDSAFPTPPQSPALCTQTERKCREWSNRSVQCLAPSHRNQRCVRAPCWTFWRPQALRATVRQLESGGDEKNAQLAAKDKEARAPLAFASLPRNSQKTRFTPPPVVQYADHIRECKWTSLM